MYGKYIQHTHLHTYINIHMKVHRAQKTNFGRMIRMSVLLLARIKDSG